MPNLLKWVLAGVGLFVWAIINGTYKLDQYSTFFLLAASLAWVFVGGLLAVRRVLRFLRR